METTHGNDARFANEDSQSRARTASYQFGKVNNSDTSHCRTVIQYRAMEYFNLSKKRVFAQRLLMCGSHLLASPQPHDSNALPTYWSQSHPWCDRPTVSCSGT